ncbi:MAG: nitroreductase family deazaflavin-dependent oxidoreductase [Chloroflexi bacterium]|nr:nitroreductase family deazaflavin-dependent oxidoreductase [Chloroflexota bacterium]
MALPVAAYRLIGRFSVSWFARLLHPLLYRWMGGRGFLGRVLGSEMILLTALGRRSGAPRTVALFAYPVAVPPGSWAVVGSRGGSGEIPAWYQNLSENPNGTIQVHGARQAVRSREVSGDEYESIFERAAGAYPGFRLYRAEASHHIPIVVLEPVASGGS